MSTKTNTAGKIQSTYYYFRLRHKLIAAFNCSTRQIQYFPSLTIFIWTSIAITGWKYKRGIHTIPSTEKRGKREEAESFCQTTEVWTRQHSEPTIINELCIVQFISDSCHIQIQIHKGRWVKIKKDTNFYFKIRN